MAKSDIQAGRAYVELYVKNSALVKGLDQAGKELARLGANIARIGGSLAAAGAAITGPLSAAVLRFVSVGSALQDMSSRTGVSGTALAELGYAAEQTGASMGDVENGLRRMQRTVNDASTGMASAADALGELGLSAAQLEGMSPEDQFELIGQRMAAIEDPTKKAAVAMEIFGRSGTMLLPMLDNVRELRQEARDLQLAPSEESVALADALGDAMDSTKASIGAVVFEIGASLASVVLRAAGVIRGMVVLVIGWVKENRGLVQMVAAVGAALLAAGTAILGLGTAFMLAGFAASGLAAFLTTMGAILGAVLSPVGLFVAAIMGAGAAWATLTESGRSAVSAVAGALTFLLDIARQTFGGIFDAIAAGDLALAGQIAITGLQIVMTAGLLQLSQMVGGIWGDTIATLGAQILSGDFSGAWASVLAMMGSVWFTFIESITAPFTAAIDWIVAKWENMASAISGWILDLAAQFPKLSKAILGVDVAAEVARSRKLDNQLGTYSEPLEDAKANAAGGISGMADRMREFTQGLRESTAANATEAREKYAVAVSGGTENTEDRLAGLRANLDALTAQAAAAREQEAGKLIGGLPDAGEGAGAGIGGKSTVGTFSAAAAFALGGGQQDRMARSLDKIERNNQKQLLEMEAVKLAIQAAMTIA